MMFFTLGSSCTPRCTACGMILTVRFTDTFSTPGTLLAASISPRRSAGIWLLAG